MLLEVLVSAEGAAAVGAYKWPLPCVDTEVVVEVGLVVGRVGAVAAPEAMRRHGLRLPAVRSQPLVWERHSWNQRHVTDGPRQQRPPCNEGRGEEERHRREIDELLPDSSAPHQKSLNSTTLTYVQLVKTQTQLP